MNSRMSVLELEPQLARWDVTFNLLAGRNIGERVVRVRGWAFLWSGKRVKREKIS